MAGDLDEGPGEGVARGVVPGDLIVRKTPVRSVPRREASAIIVLITIIEIRQQGKARPAGRREGSRGNYYFNNNN